MPEPIYELLDTIGSRLYGPNWRNSEHVPGALVLMREQTVADIIKLVREHDREHSNG